MTYALVLNDMRAPNVENVTVVRIADTPQELADWYEAQRGPWKDGRWNKAFMAGTELEWFNPVADLGLLNHYWGGIWEVTDDTPIGASLVKSTGGHWA